MRMIIDLRTEEEYSDGHVEGAINIPFSLLENAKIDIDFEDTIEVYCVTGARSLLAKDMLEKRGFSHVDLYHDGKYIS
jgi:rhodanese-related sulfurtransferase